MIDGGVKMKHINGYSAMSLGPSFFPDQKPKERKNVHRYFKDPGSAITHLIAMILSFIAGIALLIAAMSAEGTSTISNIEQIDRGYQNIESRLNAIGARITRI